MLMLAQLIMRRSPRRRGSFWTIQVPKGFRGEALRLSARLFVPLKTPRWLCKVTVIIGPRANSMRER